MLGDGEAPPLKNSSANSSRYLPTRIMAVVCQYKRVRSSNWRPDAWNCRELDLPGFFFPLTWQFRLAMVDWDSGFLRPFAILFQVLIGTKMGREETAPDGVSLLLLHHQPLTPLEEKVLGKMLQRVFHKPSNNSRQGSKKESRGKVGFSAVQYLKLQAVIACVSGNDVR